MLRATESLLTQISLYCRLVCKVVRMADIDRIADRPRAYLAGTGVLPLMSGLLFFISGSFALVQSQLMRTPEYRDYGLMVQYAGLCCAGAVIWGVAAIKRRMVFPRGGYVQLPDRNRQIVVALGVVLGGIMLTLMASRWPETRLYLDSRLVAPSFAIVFAVLCLLSLWKKRHLSTLGFALYLLCLAPVLWWMPGNSYERMSALSVAVGPPLAITGVIRLRRFLRTNPVGVETPNE